MESIKPESLIHDLLRVDPSQLTESSLLLCLEEFVDGANGLENKSEALPAVFRFLETWADADLGSPGPLVHFIEGFYPGGYEDLLLESLAKQPTKHTVWMASRLLNSTMFGGSIRTSFVATLESISEDATLPQILRDESAQVLQRHRA